jgi:hypothetical protein
MRTFIISCILLWLPTLAKAQAAIVYDATSDIHMTNQYLLGLKDFSEATRQTEILKETYDFYQKAQEALKKVNRAVSDFYKINDIVRNQVESVKLYGYYVSEARRFKFVNASDIALFSRSLTQLSESISQLLNQSKLILKPDYFKMSDAERMKFLDEVDNNITEKKTLMKIHFKRIKATEDDLSILNFYNHL